ncbi:MAG: flagellar basal body rod protein FlgC [Gammaproteobacteria bacterium]|nr:flagellar basal body rod protein FlgC [Gammaproteobacteria bacterium]
MSVFKVFDIAGSGMSAQMLRLNTVASNLANAETMASTPEAVYRARHPVFKSVLNEMEMAGNQGLATVKVQGIVESDTAAVPHYMPGHPLANQEGYVYSPGINAIEEMADMISASRSYQNNVEVLSTSKELLLRTLQLGR